MAARAIEQDGEIPADAAAVEGHRLAADQLLHLGQALFLDGVGDLVLHRRSRRAGTRAVLEGIGLSKTDLLDEPQRHGEILIGLAGEADDEVRRQGDVRLRRTQPIDQAAVVVGAVLAVHQREDAIRPRLHRQMQERHQVRRPRGARRSDRPSMSRGCDVV